MPSVPTRVPLILQTEEKWYIEAASASDGTDMQVLAVQPHR